MKPIFSIARFSSISDICRATGNRKRAGFPLFFPEALRVTIGRAWFAAEIFGQQGCWDASQHALLVMPGKAAVCCWIIPLEIPAHGNGLEKIVLFHFRLSVQQVLRSFH